VREWREKEGGREERRKIEGIFLKFNKHMIMLTT